MGDEEKGADVEPGKTYDFEIVPKDGAPGCKAVNLVEHNPYHKPGMKRSLSLLKGNVKVEYQTDRKMLDAAKKNRTILMIGSTGSGKTTLLNSMMNFLWGVKFDDVFRYKLIFEEANPDQARAPGGPGQGPNQALS